MDKFKRIILVTGTPGVGKTVFSRLLASTLDATHIDLGELAKRENLISGVDDARGTLIVDIDRVSKRLEKMKFEKDVVIDGHYAVDIVPAEEVHLVFVLRRDPDEIRKLMEEKGFRKAKVWENTAAEILDVCLFDAVNACGLEKVCEIDTSGKEIKEVVKDAISVLEGEKKRRVGIVDWLEKLYREGRLSDFL